MVEKNGMADTYETLAAAGNKAVKDGVERAVSAFGEINVFGKDNIEAFVASMTTAGKGVEALNTQIAAYAKQAMEDGVDAAKKFSGAKSVQEVIELQSEYAKSSVEAYLAEMHKVTDAFAGTMKDAAKPLNDRMTAAIEVFQAQR